MLTSYGLYAAWGLRVNSPCGLSPRLVFSHRLKREIHKTFLYETLQVLVVQINPINLLIFQPRDIPKLKGWSTSAKDMIQKLHQEIRAKSERLSTGNIYYERTFVTSISLPSDR